MIPCYYNMKPDTLYIQGFSLPNMVKTETENLLRVLWKELLKCSDVDPHHVDALSVRCRSMTV